MSYTVTLSQKQQLTNQLGHSLFMRQTCIVWCAQLHTATLSRDKVARQNRRCDISISTFSAHNIFTAPLIISLILLSGIRTITDIRLRELVNSRTLRISYVSSLPIYSIKNKATVDIRLRPLCASPPPPLCNSSIVCDQAPDHIWTTIILYNSLT